MDDGDSTRFAIEVSLLFAENSETAGALYVFPCFKSCFHNLNKEAIGRKEYELGI